MILRIRIAPAAIAAARKTGLKSRETTPLGGGADSVLVAMAERLTAHPGRGAATPGGLFGDELRIATAADGAERDRLKAKLRKRMPLHLFRWMHHGHYPDVAFMLHAVFPRPEGPPSRLIERAWDFMSEIERRPEAYFGWDIARKSLWWPSTRRSRPLSAVAERRDHPASIHGRTMGGTEREKLTHLGAI